MSRIWIRSYALVILLFLPGFLLSSSQAFDQYYSPGGFLGGEQGFAYDTGASFGAEGFDGDPLGPDYGVEEGLLEDDFGFDDMEEDPFDSPWDGDDGFLDEGDDFDYMGDDLGMGDPFTNPMSGRRFMGGRREYEDPFRMQRRRSNPFEMYREESGDSDLKYLMGSGMGRPFDRPMPGYMDDRREFGRPPMGPRRPGPFDMHSDEGYFPGGFEEEPGHSDEFYIRMTAPRGGMGRMEMAQMMSLMKIARL